MSLTNKQAVTAICHSVHETGTRNWGQKKKHAGLKVPEQCGKLKTHEKYLLFPTAEKILGKRCSIFEIQLYSWQSKNHSYQFAPEVSELWTSLMRDGNVSRAIGLD